MKMQYFHQEGVGGGGVRRVRPMLDPPLQDDIQQNIICSVNYLIRRQI